MRPEWDEIFGSAGRAASALSCMAAPVELHSYFDQQALAVLRARAIHEGFQVTHTQTERTATFSYVHGLDTPRIGWDGASQRPIQIQADRVVRFGIFEGDAVVHGDQVVYDPQNTSTPAHFACNGSTAARLALILNRREAELLCGKAGYSHEELASALLVKSGAEVVVIKLGAVGALVCEKSGATWVPAYITRSVWKLGSGDHFTAHFALRWMYEGRDAVESAKLASLATAYYCQSRGVASPETLAGFNPDVVITSEAFCAGRKPVVYLAGPFFSLSQLWLIEQARDCLRSLGLNVISPYHDIGMGSAQDVVPQDLKAIKTADLIFAVSDGMDPGTIFEVGYGRAHDKPVVLYCENESREELKMMQGSGCLLCNDFVTSIYRALWTACAL